MLMHESHQEETGNGENNPILESQTHGTEEVENQTLGQQVVNENNTGGQEEPVEKKEEEEKVVEEAEERQESVFLQRR